MKKIFSLCLVFVILVCNFCFASSGDEYQNGYNAGYNAGYSDGSDNVYKPKEPNITFKVQDEIPEVSAGGSFSLLVNFINDSSHSAKNIKITPSFEDVPLVYERPIEFSYSRTLRSKGNANASFSFKVKEDAKIGVYPIKFKVEYKNSSDEVYSRERVMYFKVNKEKVASIITISNIVTEPANVSAGQAFTLKFNVNNIGETDSKDTYIKLTGLSTEGFMPVDGNDLVYVGNIKAKSSITQSFNMIASTKIPKGSNTLGVTISHLDLNNEKVTDEKTLYIMGVLSQNESSTSTSGKPKVIIESYATTPKSIVAGDQIKFVFNFKNTSKDKNVSNMKITISSKEGEFMIANGSNTFYIDTLPAGGTMTKSIELNVKQDLSSKSYPLDISFDYEDSSANAYTATEVINIPVVEYSNLVINSVYISESMVGSPTTLSFDYVNMGKAKVSNLTASVSGDYVSTQDINYIGNLEAGNSDYYDFQVTASKEGENVGTLILTFEDSSGKKINVTKQFTGYVMTDFGSNGDPGMNAPMVDVMPEEPAQEPLNIWYVIGIGFGSFLISFIITKMITTKIIRKKLEDEI